MNLEKTKIQKTMQRWNLAHRPENANARMKKHLEIPSAIKLSLNRLHIPRPLSQSVKKSAPHLGNAKSNLVLVLVKFSFSSQSPVFKTSMAHLPRDPWLRALHVDSRPDSLPCCEEEFNKVLKSISRNCYRKVVGVVSVSLSIFIEFSARVFIIKYFRSLGSWEDCDNAYCRTRAEMEGRKQRIHKFDFFVSRIYISLY